MRVLLIDDDVSLAELLREYFSSHDVQLESAADGDLGMQSLEAMGADCALVLLDVMLPGDDGFAVCKRIRAINDVPIIMLTARGADDDRVTGLEIGADDYVPKPFNPRELLARMRAVVRRRGKAPTDEEKRSYGPLTLDAASLTATFKGEQLSLTSHEFRVLMALAERAGRPVSREELASAVSTSKGSEDGYDPSVDRSLDVHVSRLRQKLEDDPQKPTWIRTVRGVGYVFMRPS